MGFLRRPKQEVIIPEVIGTRLPETIPATCIGEACPNFKGEPCETNSRVWVSAGGPVEGRDTSRPPMRDDATFIIYGQQCLASTTQRELVAQTVVVFKPEEVWTAKIVALTGRYGDMPIDYVDPSGIGQISTIASPES